MYEYLTLDIQEPLSDATAKKHIKKAKQIIKMAVKRQIIPNNHIQDFQCGGDTNEVIPLDDAQILSIIGKDFKIKRLQEVADAYIFQIFTGFAYQDLYDLKPENIRHAVHLSCMVEEPDLLSALLDQDEVNYYTNNFQTIEINFDNSDTFFLQKRHFPL